jgi:hypothetical protein
MNFFPDDGHTTNLGRQFAAAAVQRDPLALGRHMGALAKDIARRSKGTLEKLVPNGIVVFGLGGDFDEFCVPLIEALSLSEHGMGCLWPVQARGSDAAARETIFFQQEYFERRWQRLGMVLLLQSIVDDRFPLTAVVERVRELVGEHVPILLLAGAARRDVLDGLPMRNLVFGWSALEIDAGPMKKFDLDFWDACALLDRREPKILPRMTRWLLARMNWYDLQVKASMNTKNTAAAKPELEAEDEQEDQVKEPKYKFVFGQGWVLDED